MKISIIGTGYVGLITGICLADVGNEVIFCDLNIERIENLKKNIMPIYEPNLAEVFEKNNELNRLLFTTDMKFAIENSDMLFITVGTPTIEDEGCDISQVLSVANSIGLYINHYMDIVVKSTVPIGTTMKVKNIISKKISDRKQNILFSIVSNPEFLKQGSAFKDCKNPDRIIIGCEDANVANRMVELYKKFIKCDNQIILMDITSSEMTKYVANAFLATKISFINEMANICELVGGDVNKIKEGVGCDNRIGYGQLNPGCGYGGSCLSKDINALKEISNDYGYDPIIINSVQKTNEAQKLVIFNKIVKRFGENLLNYQFAIWGLSFKPNTDDMRDAPSIILIKELIKRGAIVKVYDPKAIKNAKEVYLKDDKNIEYFEDKYTAIKDCDALIINTEWDEFLAVDFVKMSELLKNKLIYDGRNIYDRNKLKELGYEYYQIGVGQI